MVDSLTAHVSHDMHRVTCDSLRSVLPDPYLQPVFPELELQAASPLRLRN